LRRFDILIFKVEISQFNIPKKLLPLPRREMIEVRGKVPIHDSPPPSPSPIEGEGPLFFS
jgi:hypothetical protein